MQQQKLTDPFPASVKPARPGCYEVGQMLGEFGRHPRFKRLLYHWFDGEKWFRYGSRDPAFEAGGGRFDLGELYPGRVWWRGLADNSAAWGEAVSAAADIERLTKSLILRQQALRARCPAGA